MARKKIREHDGKALLRKNAQRLSKNESVNLSHLVSAAVTPDTDWKKLKASHPWLLTTKLVAKPDMLFGKRGKHGLVLLNADFHEAKKWIKERMEKTVTIGNTSAALTHFMIEPFTPHKEEYYLSIIAMREHTEISFSASGGIDIESAWSTVKTLKVPVGQSIDNTDLAILEADVTPNQRDGVIEFVRTIYRIFEDLDFVMIEINPFTVTNEGKPMPLDLVAEVDDTAFFKNRKKWEQLEFPEPFGRELTKEERYIHELDEKTGASLKLTVLNPKGRIWNMVAGGGASVIFADTVCDLGYAHELANYGEYSGAPNEEETYEYASTMIDLATRNPDGKPRVLLIGGGIANFTDVAKTFKGIIHALEKYKERLVAAKINIYVRRAGPNYQTGLDMMRKLGQKLGVPIEVYGPETHMTFIVKRAVDALFGECASK